MFLLPNTVLQTVRAQEFIKLYESPGYNVPGPGGMRLPRGYDASAMTGGMYQTGRRFGSKQVADFNRDPLTASSKKQHFERIKQRIAGGMSEDEAIRSYAKQIAVDIEELTKMYNDSKARASIS